MRMGRLQDKVMKTVIVIFLFLTTLSGLEGAVGPSTANETKTALAAIATNDLVNHTAVLASDKFEGRAPGTPAENLTVDYLVSEYQRLGLQPGNPDGTYIQKVP